MEQLAAPYVGGHHHQGPDVGERVEVATRFTGSWSRGFVVVDVENHSFRLRRLSDGHVLPIAFCAHELRVEPRPNGGPRSGVA